MKKYNNSKSTFFKFQNFISNKNYEVSFHKGWHEISIFRIKFLKTISENNFLSQCVLKNMEKKEKIFIISKGEVKIKKNRILKKKLNKFDCFHTNKSLKKFEFNCKKGSQLFIILGKKNSYHNFKNKFFNFEKNLKKINLWGGKCISRVFHGNKISVVLFKLKKDFKFHDKGHKNEQITWLIKGKMKFYIGKKRSSLLANKTSVDIGPFDYHGGMSYGAIGFDAFSPKRAEKRYS